MKIAEVYSHLNGLEYLLVHHRKLWLQIQGVIKTVDATIAKTKVSKEARMIGQLKYNPKELNKAFHDKLWTPGWKESRVSYWVTSDHRLIRKTLPMTSADQKKEIESAGKQAIYSYNQTDFVKDRVAVEVQFGSTHLLPTIYS